MLKKTCLFFLIVTLITGFVACGDKSSALTGDILTQTVISEDKIPVTVLVKYAFTINTFEKAAEEKFPNIDIIQVGNYTADMGIEEYETRLKNDDLTDIVMTWPLDVGSEYWDDRLIDLSSSPLSGKYVNSMLAPISKDGKLYYLPGPSQVRGIVYNKTLFNEKGWKVPTSFDEFVALCQTIESDGIRSLQLGFNNREVLDTAFIGYGFTQGFSTPEDAQWLTDYNNGEGNFGEHFGGALNTFQLLIDKGILKKEDLDIGYSERELMMFKRECAMVEDSVLLARMGESSTGTTDEFALMPFFTPSTNGDWARLYPVCYIGVNKHLEEKANEEKYSMVMQLLEYISTPEGQTTLAADTGAMFSCLNGMPPPDVPEIEALIPALTQGRYAVFPSFKRSTKALREGLTGMLEGTMTGADVAKAVDSENLLPPAKQHIPVLGTASEDFTVIDTGNFITDTLRAESDCDFALFLDNGKDGTYNGKGVSARLYEGNLTETDIKRIFPDMKLGERGELWEVTMTGDNLINTLEYSIPIGNNQTGWFYYFSGLKMSYAPAAKPGSRIKEITDAEGNPIDPKKVYSIAVMDHTVPEEYILSCNKTGLLIPQLLKDAIHQSGTISPARDNRFTVTLP